MIGTAIPLPGLIPVPPKGARRERGRRNRFIPEEARAPESWTLFENLRQVRARLAREQGVKPKAVLPDKALMQMVRLRPTGPDELSRVYGFGAVKLERYGPAFLEALRGFESGRRTDRAA